jgi:hypothetical protein
MEFVCFCVCIIIYEIIVAEVVMAAGWMARIVSIGKVEDIPFCHCNQTGSGPHPPPVQGVLGTSCQEVNQPEHEADHSHLVSRLKCMEFYWPAAIYLN